MFVFVISTLIKKKKRKEKTDNDDFSRLSELTSVSIFLSPAAGIIFVSFAVYENSLQDNLLKNFNSLYYLAKSTSG